jgi:hypothetical protein
MFGNRTQELPSIWTVKHNRHSSSNNDKRGDQDPENIIVVPPFFHINSCTMSNNIEQTIRNSDNDDPPRLTSNALNQIDTSHIDPSVPESDNALTLLIVGEE